MANQIEHKGPPYSVILVALYVSSSKVVGGTGSPSLGNKPSCFLPPIRAPGFWHDCGPIQTRPPEHGLHLEESGLSLASECKEGHGKGAAASKASEIRIVELTYEDIS